MKTTKKQFALFCRTCEEWIEPLGLTGWDISFLWEPIKDNATTSEDQRYKYAIITFTKTWEDEICDPTSEEIKRTALHEMLELKLCKLKGKTKDRHDVIYTMEKLLNGR